VNATTTETAGYSPHSVTNSRTNEPCTANIHEPAATAAHYFASCISTHGELACTPQRLRQRRGEVASETFTSTADLDTPFCHAGLFANAHMCLQTAIDGRRVCRRRLTACVSATIIFASATPRVWRLALGTLQPAKTPHFFPPGPGSGHRTAAKLLDEAPGASLAHPCAAHTNILSLSPPLSLTHTHTQSPSLPPSLPLLHPPDPLDPPAECSCLTHNPSHTTQ
jgi:hypothetical protein